MTSRNRRSSLRSCGKSMSGFPPRTSLGPLSSGWRQFGAWTLFDSEHLAGGKRLHFGDALAQTLLSELAGEFRVRFRPGVGVHFVADVIERGELRRASCTLSRTSSPARDRVPVGAVTLLSFGRRRPSHRLYSGGRAGRASDVDNRRGMRNASDRHARL